MVSPGHRTAIRAVLAAILLCLAGCRNGTPSTTVLLGETANINNECVGHAQGLCGPENPALPVEIAGIFATEPDCRGVRLRGLTEQEKQTPANQLPLLLDVFYQGTRNEEYMGDGRNEDEGWMFTFNGPRGHFSATVRTESEMVSRVCKAARGLGGDIDPSVGYGK